MYEQFQTARLTARPITADDLDLLRQIHGDRRVMATLSADACTHSLERSQKLLAQYCRQWQEHEYGLWLFHDRASSEFVGYCGLLDSEVLPTPAVALAYAVDHSQWRRGFAVEMSQAVLDVAFLHLELPEVIVYTLPLNYASLGVIRRLGFQYAGETIHAGLPHMLYRLQEPPIGGRAVLVGDLAS